MRMACACLKMARLEMAGAGVGGALCMRTHAPMEPKRCEHRFGRCALRLPFTYFYLGRHHGVSDPPSPGWGGGGGVAAVQVGGHFVCVCVCVGRELNKVWKRELVGRHVV